MESKQCPYAAVMVGISTWAKSPQCLGMLSKGEQSDKDQCTDTET